MRRARVSSPPLLPIESTLSGLLIHLHDLLNFFTVHYLSPATCTMSQTGLRPRGRRQERTPDV